MTEYQATPNGETIQTNNVAVEQESKGYVQVSSQAPTEYSEEQAAKQSQAEQDYKSLQEKLGVDLSRTEEEPQQDVPKQPSKEEVEQLMRMKQQVDFMKRFNTEEGKRFRDEFKQYMGLDPLEAFQTINSTQEAVKQLAQWKAQQENERSVQALKQEWGEEFEPIWTEVRDRFAQLPKHMQKSLDNLDGARLLAAQIRMERMQQGGSHVPRFDSSRASSQVSNIRQTGAPNGYVRTSDFFNDRVSEAEYIQALQSGRVIKDM